MGPMSKIIQLKLDTDTALWLVGVIAFALSALVQKLSTRFKPWSIIFRAFGNAINGDLLERIESVAKKENEDHKLDETERIKLLEKLDEIKGKMEERNAKEDEAAAVAARRRILRFADELRHKQKHSEEFFNDIFRDIKAYKNYCENHPGFQNDRAVSAIEIITETHKKCMQEDSFL